MELKAQINVVVEAREKAQEAYKERDSSFHLWLEANQGLFKIEDAAKFACQEAEDKLREMTLLAYKETENKAPEVGVGIRIKSIYAFDDQEAMKWALEHKLALKLDEPAFMKVAKVSNLPFVKITEELIATIAQDLKKV